MSTILYTTLVGDTEPIEELPAEIINYGYRLNRPGSASFSLAIDHPLCRRDVIDPGRHEVVIERDKVKVWAGPVLTANESYDRVRFGAAGLLAYLDRWFLSADSGLFDGIDQFQIARSLLNAHLNKGGADFGITADSVDVSGVLRDREYFYGKNIGEALAQLAEVDNGFDYSINPATRALEMWYPRQGSRQPDLIWEDGIRNFGRSIDATEQASQVLGIGEGESVDQLRTSNQDSGAVAEYKLTQRVYSGQEVSDHNTLSAHVIRELAYYKNPVQTVDVTIGTASFNPFAQPLGVEGKLRYSSPYEAVNEFRRLVGFDVVWESGDERAVLYLAPVVNL